MEVDDVRFPTSKTLAGSDAVHKDPDYSCVYVTLHTDDPRTPRGYGLTFTLGRGNEVVKACVRALESHVVGKDFETEIWKDMMQVKDHAGFYYRVTQDGQLRWLGPEKGVIAMASGALLNAVWDLKCRSVGKPLREYVAEMEPEELVKLIDFKHIQDFVSREDALDVLRRVRPGWQDRVKTMKTKGFRAYTTSCGWLGYPENVVREKCRESLSKGHRYFKMKVGSSDVEDDVKRASWIREEIGDENVLMMDANQKWGTFLSLSLVSKSNLTHVQNIRRAGVNDAIENMKRLAKFRPIWIEEPTNCDDVLGHAKIANALRDTTCGVATGEACSNKVLFKQLLQSQAIKYCQIDSCRVSGVSEILAILLMAAVAKVKVCPHAGGVGLCEYVRHLAMIDFVCFNPLDEEDRVCESVIDANGYFDEPCEFRETGKDGLFYVAPKLKGYARMKPAVLRAHNFPFGHVWSKEQKGTRCRKALLQDAVGVIAQSTSTTAMAIAVIAAIGLVGFSVASKLRFMK